MKKLFTLFTLALLAIPIAWGDEVKDVIYFSATGVSNGSSNYTDWTADNSKYGIESSANYSGNSAGTYGSIQLRGSSNSGIVTTASAGKVKRITLEWNSNTVLGRTVNVYGKSSAYGTPANLYSTDSSTQGTLLGTIVYGTSTSLTINGDYNYIGLRSSSSALYLTSITIVWDDDTTPATTYTVTCNSVTNGTISASTNSATEGTTVTITGTPANGYKLGTVTVNPTESGVTAPTATVSGNTATFAMPASNVTVDATFTETTSTQYKLVESTDDLIDEGEYVLAYKGASSTNIYALGGVSNNLGATITTGLELNDKILTVDNNDVKVLKLGVLSAGYTLNYDNGIYLSYTGSNNYLYTATSGTEATAQWTIAIGANGDATITNKDSNSRMLKCNPQNSRFACYTSSSSNVYNARLYRKVETGDYTITKEVNPTGGGTISCSGRSDANKTVSFTIATNDNYEFAYVEVKKEDNTAVEFTEDQNNPGTYSFTMPESNVTITAHYNQAGLLYILGEANGKFDNNDWQPNQGTLMTYSDGKYTARVYFKGYTKYNNGDGFSEFSFTKKLATNDKDHNGWNEINYDGSRYGSGAGGSYWGIGTGTGSSDFDTNIPLYNNSQSSYRVPAGVYDIEVDLKANPHTVKVTPVTLNVTLNPASGTFNIGQEIAISSNLTGIVAATGSGEAVDISHQIGNSAFVDGATATLNTVGENITVTGKASLGHIEVTGTGTYTIENKYTVTKSAVTNGTLDVSGTNVAPGTQVTITATPNNGYQVASVTVTRDDNNETVAITDNGDGTYSFTMPASNVTVAATFAVQQYAINVVSQNCTVTVTSPADYNSQVTYTVAPRSDKYEISTNTVTYGENGTKPITDNGDGTYSFYMPAADVTLTVLCTKKSTGSNQFTLVTQAADIVAGGEYVILKDDGSRAMSYANSGYDTPSTEFTLSDNVVTLSEGSNVSIFKLATGTVEGKFKIMEGTSYVVAPTSTGNTPTHGTTQSDWTVSYSNSAFTVATTGSTVLTLRYNSNHFRVYSNSGQGDGIKLYKRIPVTAMAEVSPETSDVVGSVNVSVGSDTEDALVRYKVERNSTVETDWTVWTTSHPIDFTLTGEVDDVVTVTVQAKEADQELEPGEEEEYDENSATYTFIRPVAPTITPTSCHITDVKQSVTITSDYTATYENAVIEYSTDDGTTWNTYEGKFDVFVEAFGESTTVKARITVNGVTSEEATATYTRDIQPVVFSPASGTYRGDQTCQMFSTTSGARIYYTTDGTEPVMNQGTTQLYTGEIEMSATGTYQFKAVAYIGTTASTITEASYTIQDKYTSGNYLYSVAELNEHATSSENWTMVNPVQVIYMSTYQKNGNQPEFCLVRDNTGYGMIYFGKQNSYHNGFKVFEQGDWIKGGYYGPISQAWSQEHGQLDTHPELGDSYRGSVRIHNWSNSLWMENEAVLPEYIDIPSILASETPGNTDYWGHFVHLRKTTIELTSKDDDGKWSGRITAENGTDKILYYDKFYLQYGKDWTTTSNDFTGHPNRTFDVYGFVACHLLSETHYQIAPFSFAWIDKPTCDHETGDYASQQHVKLFSDEDPDATIWYKTSEMDDYAIYHRGSDIVVNNTTTIDWYATKNSTGFSDELESLHGSVTLTFIEIPKPVISPESIVKTVGESTDATIAYEEGKTIPDGAVIVYTTDGSDPKNSENVYTLGTTLTFSTTTTVRAITRIGNATDGYVYSAEADPKTYTFVKSNGVVYDLITNVNQLIEDGVYMIVSQNYGEALSIVQNEANRGAAGVMFVENTDKAQVYGNSDVALFQLSTPDHAAAGEFLFNTGSGQDDANGYLCVGSESDNTLLCEAEMDELGNDIINVTIDADGRAHLRLNYSGGTDRYIQYWNRDRYFTTYKTEDDDRAVYIYGTQATPLAVIEKSGTLNKGYTVADNLQVVWVNKDKNVAWARDLVDNINAVKIPTDTIDYMQYAGQQKGEWQQNNWVMLDFSGGQKALAQLAKLENNCVIKGGTLVGEYTDARNYTIKVSKDAVLQIGESIGTYVPNVYCAANYGANKDGIQTGSNDIEYWFMTPKVMEVATHTWSVWNDNPAGFFVPAFNDTDFGHVINGAHLKGGFAADLSTYNLNPFTPAQGQAYEFLGVVMLPEPEGTSTPAGAPRRAGSNSHDVEDTNLNADYKVAALNLTGGQGQIVTGVNQLQAGREVVSVTYCDVAGRMSQKPFEGLNIIVTRYTDGTTVTRKALF